MFQHKSFSPASFSQKSWVFDGEPIPKPLDNGWLGGGADCWKHADRQQSAKEKQAEREALGIMPAEVKRAVEIVARIEARDPVAALDNEAQAIEALARELEQNELEWRDYYGELLRDELRKLINDELTRRLIALMEEQDEEQMILLMLSEM